MLTLEDEGRRRILRGGAAAAIITLTGCGGGSSAGALASGGQTASAAPAPDPGSSSPMPTTLAWNVIVPPFNAGGNGIFDLSTTLPTGVARGGTFGVDPSGASLPSGMSLSSAGILSVGSASVSTVGGIIFTYDTV